MVFDGEKRNKVPLAPWSSELPKSVANSAYPVDCARSVAVLYCTRAKESPSECPASQVVVVLVTL